MQEVLYINGTKADLIDRSVARTLQINNFGEFQDRQANYSNTIRLPKTEVNRGIFNFLGSRGSVSSKFKEELTVKYIVNGVELVSNGIGIVTATDKYFNMVIYDGNISVSEALKGKQINELNFSGYNHQASVLNVFNSLNNTSGYVWAVNDTQGNRLLTIEENIPYFYIHTMVDLILTQAGFTYSGAIFSNPEYLSQVMTVNKGINVPVTSSGVVDYSTSFSNTYNASYGVATVTDYLLSTHNATTDGQYLLSFSGFITENVGTALVIVQVNGGTVLTFPPSGLPAEVRRILSSGDTITVTLRCTTFYDGFTHSYNITTGFNAVYTRDNSYFSINFNTMFGDISQLAFMKEIMQRFNLTFKTVNQTELEFIQAETLITDLSSAEDWSDKYIQTVKETYKNGYAQVNKLIYQYDNDEDTFADGEIVVNNPTLPDEKTLLSSIFKASVGTAGIGSPTAPYEMNYYDGGESQEDGYRIFTISQSSQTTSVNLETGDGSVAQTVTTSFLTFDDLSMSDIVANHYPTWDEFIENYKTKNIQLNLSIIDIVNLDFFKLKYFSQLGRYYYINKISNFKPNKIANAELVQIPL